MKLVKYNCSAAVYGFLPIKSISYIDIVSQHNLKDIIALRLPLLF